MSLEDILLELPHLTPAERLTVAREAMVGLEPEVTSDAPPDSGHERGEQAVGELNDREAAMNELLAMSISEETIKAFELAHALQSEIDEDVWR